MKLPISRRSGLGDEAAGASSASRELATLLPAVFGNFVA